MRMSFSQERAIITLGLHSFRGTLQVAQTLTEQTLQLIIMSVLLIRVLSAEIECRHNVERSRDLCLSFPVWKTGDSHFRNPSLWLHSLTIKQWSLCQSAIIFHSYDMKLTRQCSLCFKRCCVCVVFLLISRWLVYPLLFRGGGGGVTMRGYMGMWHFCGYTFYPKF